MSQIMESVVKRYFKGSPHFIRSEPGVNPPHLVSIPSGEAFIGWYQNPPPWHEHIVAFTDQALYTFAPSETFRVLWEEITDYESLESKTDVMGVTSLHADRNI